MLPTSLLPLVSLGLALTAALAAAQTEPPEEKILGAASALRIEADEGSAVSIEAGTRLYSEPHLHAPAVTVVDVEVALAPLERRGDWVRVRFGERTGWAFFGEVPAPPETEPEDLMEAPQAPAPPADKAQLEPLSADPRRLRQALSLLDYVPTAQEAGPFRIYTDVAGKRKRQVALNVAQHLADSYAERYPLLALRDATFAVIIFEREASYRRYEDSVTNLGRLRAQGHAGFGVAALSAEKRTPEELATLLIHELTHLLNRRSFRRTPPPWLEEGMANDLAYCQLDREGRILLETLGGKAFVTGTGPDPFDRRVRRWVSGTFHIQGPIASLNLLKSSVDSDELLPLPELLDLTWREFVEPDGRELRYVQSAFLVRYLLDEAHGKTFQAFLTAYQAGGSSEPDALLEAIGLDWEELTKGFRQWIVAHNGR